MVRKVGHALHDILEAIDPVEEITRGKTLAEFEQSWQLRWLVQRAIEIISEASRAIPAELANSYPEIPWQRVRGLATSFATNIGGSPTHSSGTSLLMSCRDSRSQLLQSMLYSKSSGEKPSI